VQAYSAAFEGAEFTVWNRSPEAAQAFAADTGAQMADDLQAAVRAADVITCATMASAPIIAGEWLQSGQHINLIGAYRPDLREADDTAMTRSRVFVDSRETTVGHIGELMAPIAAGVMQAHDIVADYYQMDAFQRQSDDEITLFKNGGGAHMDLMVSRYVLEAWRGR
jgi:ornithine cyclodeaminase